MLLLRRWLMPKTIVVSLALLFGLGGVAQADFGVYSRNQCRAEVESALVTECVNQADAQIALARNYRDRRQAIRDRRDCEKTSASRWRDIRAQARQMCGSRNLRDVTR